MVLLSITHAWWINFSQKWAWPVLFLHLPFSESSICKLQRGRKFHFYWLDC